ncbi:hypothetical protein J7T55_013894 [Diaporthe amygdali]|uniref:uncharacterized protein n=1 Tax=Phomopsis amygdali TaxID=1214568 RepID=UPI0022FEA669|nr:uncharacterized protein J7T55_013894 [Diaporthe amygdali]KAJ0119691.1 hypothetical protein J7T55_013894 [Diaporthe amygdali]
MASSHTREGLLAPISQTLAGKGIPAVLWGNFLLTIHGVPSIVSEADFVVHDSLLCAAIAALMDSQELKLSPCLDPETCYISRAKRLSPGPAFHAHMPDSNAHVALHVQSATLGAVVPPLRLNQSANLLSLGLIPASHPSLPSPDELGLGHGSLFPQDDGSPSPVWVLPSHTYLEAIIQLIREDVNIYVTYFMATVIYFMYSSGQIEKWWRQNLGLPISKTPSPTRPRGLSPASAAAARAADASNPPARGNSASAPKLPSNAASGFPADEK